MKQQDWIDYFEAVNGRSPEAHELEAARVAGEFEAEGTPTISETVEQQVPTSPVQPQVQVAPETVSPQPQVTPVQPQPQAAQTQTQQVPTQQTVPPGYQGNVQEGQQPPLQFQQGPATGEQQLYTVQVAVPSEFSLFWKQFWIWLKASWQHPTVDRPTHKYNGVTVYGLLVFFTALTTLMPLMKMGVANFSIFFTVLLGFAFVNFAFILAGFAVKKFIYKEARFTFGYSFEWFGRLLSLNIILMAGSTLFAMLEVSSLSILLTALSNFLFIGASGYTLFHTVNHSNMDMFHKYLLASILYGVILAIFFAIGVSIAGEMLIDSLMGNLGDLGGLEDLISPYGSNPFGY
ncbi:DUF6574 domain-containing protein [Streptococcus cameli]